MPPATAGSQIFPDYYTQAELLEAHVIKGTLRVNPKCTSDAFVKVDAPYMLPCDVTCPEECFNDALTDDIFIRGAQHRNRALNGDIVYVEILPVADWDYEKAMLASAQRYDDLDDDDDGTGPEQRAGLPGIPCGRVVYIVERSKIPIFCVLRNGQYSAASTIEDDLRVNTQSQKRIRAVSLDKRYPWFLIDLYPLLDEYEDLFQTDPNDLKGPSKQLPEYTVFQVQLVRWEAKDRLPKGRIVGLKGKCLDTEFEAAYALQINEIEEFADPLPEESEKWAEAKMEEIRNNFDAIAKQRRDLRHLMVLTIDPATARDLDDAIHVRVVPAHEVAERYKANKRSKIEHANVLEVGVHIADVSFVVTPDSPPDESAAKRTTTVYLPHEAYHMLPRSICQDLCSLTGGSDKLAYSVICYFDRDTNKLINDGTQWKGVWAPTFCKSVIRNRAQLNYDQVQNLIDSEILRTAQPQAVQGKSELVELVDVAGAAQSMQTSEDYRPKELTRDIKLLYGVAKGLRGRRFTEGSVELSSLQLRFRCDPESGKPISIKEERHSDSHWLIEELMLLANQLVAQRMWSSPGGEQFALLRVHAPIKSKKIAKLLTKINDAGVNATVDDFAGVERLKSFLERVRATTSRCKGMLIEQLVIMNLEQACYQWAGGLKGGSTRHFALGFELYTHFTSPIRRYADLLVHRQLEYVVANEKESASAVQLADKQEFMKAVCRCEGFSEDTLLDEESSVLTRANDVRMKAKRAGDRASASWLLMYLAARETPLTSRCIVTGIADNSFQVHLTEFFADVRVEFEVCLAARDGSVRLLRKVRKEHLEKIKIPRSFSHITRDGSRINQPEMENANLKWEDLSVRIEWADKRHTLVKMYDEITVWVLPSREVPLSLIVIPTPADKIVKPADKADEDAAAAAAAAADKAADVEF